MMTKTSHNTLLQPRQHRMWLECGGSKFANRMYRAAMDAIEAETVESFNLMEWVTYTPSAAPYTVIHYSHRIVFGLDNDLEGTYELMGKGVGLCLILDEVYRLCDAPWARPFDLAAHLTVKHSRPKGSNILREPPAHVKLTKAEWASRVDSGPAHLID